VLSEIVNQTKNQSVELMVADLSSLSSVRKLASDFGAKHSSLEVLVNNAGVFKSGRLTTPDGFELMFATNYLGPFLLTRLLIPSLEAASPARIVNVTAPSTTRPNPDDLQGERKFSTLGAFGASKAADLLFTYALARKLAGRGITVNAYHPGLVKTSLNRGAPGAIRALSGLVNLFVGRTPEKASEGLVQLATSNDFAATNGQLVHDGKVISAPFIEDKDLQETLWTKTCALVGLSETL